MAATQVVFDYDLSKAKYMANVKKCFNEDSTHSESTIRKTIEILKGSEKTPLHKYYEIDFAFGREILTEKRKSPTDPKVQVLNFEDIFDIFIKFHILNNHKGGRQHLTVVEKQLKTLYNYPSVCLSLLVKSCNVCRSRTPKPAKTFTKIGSVYLTVMFQKGKYNDCKYILIYIDKSTDFVVLRPICQKLDTEVAMEIFKILMQFGPPQKLSMHGHNIYFNKRVGSYLRQVCPMFTFSIEYRSDNLEPSAYVVNKLQEWMTVNGSMSWEIGCSVVQKELNTERLQSRQIGDTKNISPYELLYGRVCAKPIKIKDGANIPLKFDKVFEMRFKTNEVQNASTSVTTQIEDNLALNDEVVELRIPNTENFNVDLLSQFEDSEVSQEYEVTKQPVEIKSELEEIVINENDIEGNDVVLQPSNVIRLCKEIDDTNVIDTEVTLDLEVDEGQSEEEEETEPMEPDYPEDFNKRRSLRLMGNSKITEWIEDKGEEVVLDDVMDMNDDPLNMNDDDTPI